MTVQAMVYGDLDHRSGSGVICSRNPVTGGPGPWGEWAVMRQGPDLVSGRCVPQTLDGLRALLPDAYAALARGAALLEADAGPAQEIEYTIERGKPWFLQARAARLTRPAAQRPSEPGGAPCGPGPGKPAGGRDEPPLARGICAAPGTAAGLVVKDVGDACARAGRGEDIILARVSTSPADIDGMLAARAVITDSGGATSHAAVICREIGGRAWSAAALAGPPRSPGSGCW